MEDRTAKLALARKKLKDHQQRKLIGEQKDNNITSEGLNAQENLDSDGIAAQNLQNNVNNQHVTISEPAKINDISPVDCNVPGVTEDSLIHESDVNITEILISNKRNLEFKVNELLTKLSQLEQSHCLVIDNYKVCSQKVVELEKELENINGKYLNSSKEVQIKDLKLNELNSVNLSLTEKNNNLVEQLEFTKTVLNAKEAENDSLHNQLYNLQNQYDVMHLQLQQLTNGSPTSVHAGNFPNSEKTEALLQKISNLEHQLSLLQKEKDQINLHYEHYAAELNEQLRTVLKKNEELTQAVENLSNRENSLIEQISDMEIRIQNYNINKKNTEVDCNTNSFKYIQDNTKELQDELNNLRSKYEELKKQHVVSVAQVEKLSEMKQEECNHENISLSKLNADMASDKVAAQRATEQNKKLKQDLQELEDAFVKMSKDKLELTEKISAEKYLNRELTIKLSEVDEKAKDMQIKLKAKDEEMMRLQSNYREIEKECEKLMNLGKNESIMVLESVKLNSLAEESDKHSETEHTPLIEEADDKSSHGLQRADAMMKLQERFLRIMTEVADLSDEKHRLEHIILQLQNETDTICEYVALYQQQRSLLKRRDEERSAQLKIFQQECGKLKCELEELSEILTRFAQDKELSSYFETESNRIDMENVMALLSNLKNNSLIDTNKKNVEFKNFYPCNCCSGKLIDI